MPPGNEIQAQDGRGGEIIVAPLLPEPAGPLAIFGVGVEVQKANKNRAADGTPFNFCAFCKSSAIKFGQKSCCCRIVYPAVNRWAWK